MLSQWHSFQLLMTTPADQVHVFDDKYYLAGAGLFFIFGRVFIELVLQAGFRRVVSAVPFQVCLLTAAAVAIIPTAITGRGIQAAYISDMSLPLGICACALLGAVPLGRFPRWTIGLVALFYFGLLYRDERLLNRFEDRLERAVAEIPPAQRVINAIDDTDMHVYALAHMMDRVCVGRCYSYANYEASTGQFRVRVTGANSIVAGTYDDSWRMQNGGYLVKERDLPLYAVTLDDTGRMVIQSLRAGERTGTRYWKALPSLF